MHDFCAEIIQRGGRVAPPRYTTDASKFNDSVAKGLPLSGEIQKECDSLSLRQILACSQKWSLIKSAAGALAGARKDEDLLFELGGKGRFGILRQAAASGTTLHWSCIAAAAKRLAWSSTRETRRSLFDEAEGGEFPGLAREPRAREAFEGPANEIFFSAAAWESNVEALMAMLDAGLRPGQAWRGGAHIPDEVSVWCSAVTRHNVPLLIVAAASPKGRGAFDALKSFAPALEEAKRSPASARVLSVIPVQRLAELHEAGVDIGSTDSVGTFAHWWAKLDSEPRAGWATLASRAPDIFEMKDPQGERASERMAQKLREGKERDDFMASLSRIESREIRKEIGAPKKAAASAKPRNRL